MPHFAALNTFDCLILGLMLWSVGWAAYRGFSNEFFGLLGLAVAFFATAYLGPKFDTLLAGMLPDNALARFFSRALFFLLCIMIVSVIAGLAAKALRMGLSRPVDHSLGLLFGFVRAALIVLLPFLLVDLHIDPKVYPDWLTHSKSYPFLTGGAHLLRKVLPASEIRDNERTDLKSVTDADTDPLQKTMDDTNAKTDEKSDKNKKDPKTTGNHKLRDLLNAVKDIFKSL